MENEKNYITEEENQTIDFIAKMDLYDKGIYDFYTDLNDNDILIEDFDIVSD